MRYDDPHGTSDRCLNCDVRIVLIDNSWLHERDGERYRTCRFDHLRAREN